MSETPSEPEAGLSPDAPAEEPAAPIAADEQAPSEPAGSGVAEAIPTPATQADVDRLKTEVDAMQAANDAGQPNDAALATAKDELAAAEASLAGAPAQPAAPIDPADAGAPAPEVVSAEPPSAIAVTVSVGDVNYHGVIDKA